MDEEMSQSQSAPQSMNQPSAEFHTMAATNALKRYRDRTSSWTEYQDSTIALMMRIVYKSLTLALKPFVVAMTDDIRGITDSIKALSYGQGFEQGSLTVNAMYVQWKDDGLNAFAGIRPGDADLSLDEHNVSAVLRLLKQRSRSEDTLLVMMVDMPSQVLDTTQAMAGVGLGIDATPSERQPKVSLRTTRPQTPLRSISPMHPAARSPQKPTQATPTNPNSGNGRGRTKEATKASHSVDDTRIGGPGLQNSEERQVVESPINYTSRHDQLSKHSVTPKARQPARRSSPSPRFPQSFHDAQRETAEKRKHRHSSGSEDDSRHRQKVDDSPGAGRRDRRRDDPYGFG